MSIAGVVLAAGASRRLGRPKQQVVIVGETLLARAVRVACEAELSPIIVVTRGTAEIPDLLSDGVRIVVNSDAAEGIASSIRCGVAVAADHGAAGVVLMACDQPGMRAAHLMKLIAEPLRLTASAYAECVGIPAYFPRRYFAALMDLRGDTGARSMLRGAHAIGAEELQLDIDTERDVETARALFEEPEASS